MRLSRCLPALLPVLVVCLASAGAASQEGRSVWKKTVLDTRFRAEGAAAADVDRDGRMDVIAGNVWYRAPEWTSHELRPAPEFNAATGYSDSFLVFAEDVDADGWTDVLVIDFPGKPARWLKNPGPGTRAINGGGYWTSYPITASACNESPNFADLDGDGKPELVTPFEEKRMAFYRPGSTPEQGFEQTIIGAEKAPGCGRFSHGLGVGDVNGDGRRDIVCTEGYYEAPAPPAKDAKKEGDGTWKFVAAKLGPACAQMHVHDIDGDGDGDVIASSAHQIGVWWYEQRPGADGPEFVRHVIDDSFSQSHALVMADINRDGQPDFVTGKRWWAHGPNGDVNPGDPAVLYWFEYRRTDGRVEWIRHQIDSDSGVGTQFTVTDMNRDRRPDVVIANKKGVFLFEQGR